MQILSKEQEILKTRKKFEALLSMIEHRGEPHTDLGQIEENLWNGLLGLGLSLMQAFVANQGTGDLGPTVEFQGKALRRLSRLHSRRYVSVFGELSIPRTVYGTRETQKHELVPLDAALNLPDSDFSYLLQGWSQRFCVQNSYRKSAASIQEILGLSQSVRSLESMSRSMQDNLEPFRAGQAPPNEVDEAAILVLTVDGKGVPMMRENGEEPPTGRRAKGEKANKKRMACVGAAYTVDSFVRTPEEIVDEVMRGEKAAERPKPKGKEVRAELIRVIDGEEVNAKDKIFGWLQQESAVRNPGHQKPVVILMDGERALWSKAGEYLPEAVMILDLFHVMERLWDIAHCFFPEGSKEVAEYVRVKLQAILSGKAGRAIGGMRQKGTKSRLKGAKQKIFQAALTYLENNKQAMRYDVYLEMGYPIASGVVEGACRHLVKDRMELTGMRWTPDGAQAILGLRALHINGQWEKYQAYRLEAERERLYPYRDEIEKKLRAAA